MNIYKKISAFVICIVLLAGCTDGFERINTNPNKPSETEPEYVFISSAIKTMMTFGSRNNYWIFGNYSGQVSIAGGMEPTYGHGGKSDEMWRSIYVDIVLPLVEIDKNYGELPGYNNRTAIARIWKSYVLSQAVAMWGPIPYTRAAMGDVYVKYDSEEYIYKDLLTQLKIDADLLDDAGDKYPSEAEPVFESNIAQWRKFAHSIRLRIASRCMDFEDAEVRTLAREVINEELDGNEILASNNDNCRMRFSETDRAYRNPLFVDVEEGEASTGGVAVYPVIHEQVLMWLTAYNDPRITIFCQETESGYTSYLGRPSTLRYPPDVQVIDDPYAAKEVEDFSKVGRPFVNRTAYHTLIAYPEICCIRAEAAYRGIWTGAAKSAEDYYYESIDAFSERYKTEAAGGATISAAKLKEYKEQPGIKWNTKVDTLGVVDEYGEPIIYKYYDFLAKAKTSGNEQLFLSNCYLGEDMENGIDYNYKRIVVQHWMALFFQGVDAWTLLRRTQLINFPPVWYPSSDYQLASKYDWTYLPHRLVYPINEMSINPRETATAIDMIGGYNSLHARLKFAKPVVAFDDFEDDYPSILGRE